MNLFDCKESFLGGIVDKSRYRSDMYTIHKNLFDYAKYLPNTDIERIELSDNKVILVTRHKKIKLLVNEDEIRSVPLEILNFGKYENEEMDMILRMINKKSVIFDIGANVGYTSLTMAKTYKSASIYAFEPIPNTYKNLESNIKINKQNNIKIYPYGFSNEEKEVKFYYYQECSGGASLENVSQTNTAKEIKSFVTTLDRFVEQNGVYPDFIKCDVEGAELFVFQGGIQTLKKSKPIVFTEMLRKWAKGFGYHPMEILKLFEDIGYKCYALGENRQLKEVNLINDETKETNFFFIHGEIPR